MLEMERKEALRVVRVCARGVGVLGWLRAERRTRLGEQVPALASKKKKKKKKKKRE